MVALGHQDPDQVAGALKGGLYLFRVQQVLQDHPNRALLGAYWGLFGALLGPIWVLFGVLLSRVLAAPNQGLTRS